MATLRVEQLNEQLVVRLTPEATSSLGLHAGDEVEVELVRRVHGEVSLVAAEVDRQLRLERKRVFLRRLQALN
jgi:hypothetical protein